MIGEFPTQRDFCPNREIEVDSSCFVWKARGKRMENINRNLFTRYSKLQPA